MKSAKGYIFFIVILLGIIMIFMYRMPQRFIWKPTFHHNDYQPFGAAIFDDVVEASLPDSYTISEKTFYQLEQDSVQNTAILVLSEYAFFDRVDLESLFNLLDRGNKVMLVSNSFGYALTDTLKIDYSYSIFNFLQMKQYANSAESKDTIQWNADDHYAGREFYINPLLVDNHFYEYDSLATQLATREVEYEKITPEPIALKYKFGTGELYVVSTPLLFTNYGILDDDISPYIFRLLSQMRGMPMIRVQSYEEDITESQSPLRYFLSHPPLRWGLYMALLLVVVFMIFTARRRQRPIPVIRAPENKSVEFAELIGTLYFQKANHVDLVRKRYIYFADNLRRNIQVDLDDDRDDHDHARHISLKTGIDEDRIYKLLLSLRRVLEEQDAYVSEDLMKKYINRMNRIENQLS